MSEIILSIIIAVLLVERYLANKAMVQEREKMMKMFMAKDLREVTDNEVLEKMPEQKIIPPPDNVSMDDVIEDEALFDRHINAMKAEAKEQLDKELNP